VFSEMESRKYELKERAERQAETRRRIAAATADLHQEVGPARTTVAEIARRAGVQRLTVYNNFPEEGELFAACQEHFLAAHPPPDPSAAFALEDPAERLRVVLRALYPWYRATERMTGNVQRDRASMPALDELVAETSDAQLSGLADALASGFRARGRRAARVRAAVGLALDFWSWRRLTSEGLDDRAAADLMTETVVMAAAPAAR
jgi:AcrR family transcriptional regulator